MAWLEEASVLVITNLALNKPATNTTNQVNDDDFLQVSMLEMQQTNSSVNQSVMSV